MTIIINNEKYSLTNDPTHGVIKKIKNQQNQIIVSFFEKHKTEVDAIMKKKKNSSVDSIMETILIAHPSEMIAYAERCEDINVMATISLATNKLWSEEDIDNISGKELQTIYNKCSKVIGGNYADFLENYQIISTPNTKESK